ncbi:hypothetical protein NTGBS_410011 [Candidatus Nitrotoga sp. BS]|nr:hypothetical protein NTGBS_410011 [Candidatus Nitrotoga sp. BS]
MPVFNRVEMNVIDLEFTWALHGSQRPGETDMPFLSHEEYFISQTAEARRRLELIQKVVESQIPGATRTISYNMPAFKKQNTFIYFAAFKTHIGIYPPVTDDFALISETEAYRGPKGNLSFPHSEELPLALIGRVIAALASQ